VPRSGTDAGEAKRSRQRKAPAVEVGYLGHNFADRFQLLKGDDGRWQIIANLFSTF
jgi:hypothetical protein